MTRDDLKYYREMNRKISQKKRFARANGKESKVLDFILVQIEILEELEQGLTEKQILELLQKDNETQVQNTCLTLKIA